MGIHTTQPRQNPARIGCEKRAARVPTGNGRARLRLCLRRANHLRTSLRSVGLGHWQAVIWSSAWAYREPRRNAQLTCLLCWPATKTTPRRAKEACSVYGKVGAQRPASMEACGRSQLRCRCSGSAMKAWAERQGDGGCLKCRRPEGEAQH